MIATLWLAIDSPFSLCAMHFRGAIIEKVCFLCKCWDPVSILYFGYSMKI
jgi:hypothetical protein